MKHKAADIAWALLMGALMAAGASAMLAFLLFIASQTGLVEINLWWASDGVTYE